MLHKNESMLYQPPLQLQEHFFLGHCFGKTQFCQHWHYEMEVLYCVSGEIQVQIAEQKYTATQGELLIIGSCTPHSFLGLTNDTESLTLEFGSALLGDGFRQITQYIFPVHTANSRISSIFEKMYELMDKRDLSDRFMLKGHLFTLISAMIEELGKPNPAGQTMSGTFRQADGINQVLVYLADGYRGTFSLDEAARIAGYEKKNFCRVFKQLMGVSFYQYLNTYRVEQACQLFRSGHDAIGKVGELCGIPEPKTFCRLFKQHTGMTPTEFVKTFCRGDRVGNL